jgi:hypothetical protein
MSRMILAIWAHDIFLLVLQCLPFLSQTTNTTNSLSRWQRVQRFNQQLYKSWSSHYLSSLKQRRKWHSQQPDLQPGKLVLIREDNLPPMFWKLAIIRATIPGSGGHVRVEQWKPVLNNSSDQFINQYHWLSNNEISNFHGWSMFNLYGTAFKSRLRAHGTEFSPRRPFKCPVHM